MDFEPYGYDERQFCSPGFDLPVGLFQRSQFGSFPEYHTSGDDLSFIKPDYLAQSFELLSSIIEIIEGDCRPLSTSPYGEPHLGRRGLYSQVGGDRDAPPKKMALLWVLNLADGEHSLLDISERANMSFAAIRDAADSLHKNGLLTL